MFSMVKKWELGDVEFTKGCQILSLSFFFVPI